MRPPNGGNVTVALGRDAMSVPQRQIEALVRSLRLLGSSPGDAVAEEISALSLAGVRIDLRLPPGELRALIDALVALQNPVGRLDPGLSRILVSARAQELR